MSRNKIVIKKYPNRRLYNTLTSCYIKLEDITEMVKKDEAFVVIDLKTGADITRLTLAQILIEHESSGVSLLPESLIRSAIKFHNHPFNAFIYQYFEKMSDDLSKNLDTKWFDDIVNFSKQMEEFNKNNLQKMTETFFGRHNNKK